MRDRGLIYAACFARSAATGMLAVVLGIHLSALRLSPAESGAVVGSGLAGGALACLGVTLAADSHGRRRTLVELALLGLAGTITVALASDWVALAAGALVGMVNGMGRDRGASIVLEQAMLPAVGPDVDRTRAFAVYNVVQDTGHALGALAAGLPTALQLAGLAPMSALRVSVACAGLLAALGAATYLRLSAAVEAVPRDSGRGMSEEARRIVGRISVLFLVDGLGGGFLTAALVSYYFFVRFGARPDELGLLYFAARAANAASYLAAAWLARRIGLVNTMVWTHMPSSLLLVAVAFAPSFPVAALLFLIREGLVEMDVPTRQSYLMAVVRPEDRTAAAGITSLVRLAGWAVGPFLAGLAMQGMSLAAPLFVGAGLKIGYDIALYFSFRQVKPPEETAGQ